MLQLGSRGSIIDHARSECARRGLPLAVIAAVLARPEQRFTVRPGRDVVQSRVLFEEQLYLVRVFVEVDRDPAEVVTAYRSSKIGKYWRNDL